MLDREAHAVRIGALVMLDPETWVQSIRPSSPLMCIPLSEAICLRLEWACEAEERASLSCR